MWLIVFVFHCNPLIYFTMLCYSVQQMYDKSTHCIQQYPLVSLQIAHGKTKLGDVCHQCWSIFQHQWRMTSMAYGTQANHPNPPQPIYSNVVTNWHLGRIGSFFVVENTT